MMSNCVDDSNQKHRQEYKQNALGKKESTNCSRTVLKNKYELECVQIQAKKQYFYKIITRS